MTATETRARPASPITINRVLLFVSAAFFAIAALTVGVGLGIGPAWAWGFGGFAAWVLAGAV